MGEEGEEGEETGGSLNPGQPKKLILFNLNYFFAGEGFGGP